MDKKQAWIKLVEEKSHHYLNLGDGGFDEMMQVHLVRCSYEEKSVTYGFKTQKWQINEKGGIHGGAIAGMFDTAFGVVANFTAGENEATTTDMTVSFLRGVEMGMELELTVYIVKAGRSLIRQRAELTDAATGKLLATASGSWMPL
ncbi:MAG: PaaI family thioesterase [Oscillospiraceae bacterium]|nr:PaaI family thioesterase [Oscillospiraceae bacterium]